MSNDIERTVKDTTDAFRAGAGLAPLKRPVETLLTRLQDESDLCRNEGAADIAELLDEASAELIRLRALLPSDGVVVPREPTEEIERAFNRAHGALRNAHDKSAFYVAYKAMLAAAQDKP